MADLRDIDNVLGKFEKRFYRQIAKAQIQVARHVLVKLASKTPVATGRCQSNWVLTDQPSGAPYDPDPPSKDAEHGDKRGIAFNLVKSQARQDSAVLLSTVLVGRHIKPVYIHNRTPYLRYLNRGHSPQAPPGFIRKEATLEYRNRINKLDRVLGGTLGVSVDAN